MLYCKKLDPNAILPTVNHPGEDLGYDLYATVGVTLRPHVPTKVHTGIASRYVGTDNAVAYGLLIRDRSSMSSKGITISGGVIDAGYTGEIMIVLTSIFPYEVHPGDKIAQMIPMPVLTHGGITEVNELPISSRSGKGFGSSGR